MPKRRNPRHAADSAQWSATNAARRLVDLRDATIEQCQAVADAPSDAFNPYLLIRCSEDSTAFEHHLERLNDRGRKAVYAAASMSGLGGIPDGTDEFWRENARALLRRESQELRVAEGYVTSPAMHLTTLAAVNTLAAEDVSKIEWGDLPAEHGFVLFPQPVLLQLDPTQPILDIAGLSWFTGQAWSLDPRTGRRNTHTAVTVRAWIDIDGPVKNPEFDHVRTIAKRAGVAVPALMIGGSHSFVPYQSAAQFRDVEGIGEFYRYAAHAGGPGMADGVTVAEVTDVPEVQTRPVTEWSQAYLLAFWRLAAQRIAAISPFRDGLPGDAPHRDHHDTRVVQLRAFSAQSDSGDSGRQYQHRWIVRMHKVNQWYPSEQVHRIIWRGPYIKGPEHAPLLVGEKVQALVR